MNLYNRGGKINDKNANPSTNERSNVMEFPLNKGQAGAEGETKGGVRIDGFKQVLDMLIVADPAFRESLLRRLAQRDPALVQNLRRHLAQSNL